VNLNQFLETLSAVDQKEHMDTIPSLDCDNPEFYWVFRNVDFEEWSSATSSRVLWLSGPSQCNINQVSSYIVGREKNKALEANRFVLYFFCSTRLRRSIVAVFVHTLLKQIVCCSPADERILIVQNFLHSLLEEAFKNETSPNWKQRGFKEEDSPERSIQNILNAPANELFTALVAVLGDEQERCLSIIVDGLDKAQDQKGEFTKGIRKFVDNLHKPASEVKILLTSGPLGEIKDLFDGIPSIEHDMERNGSSASHEPRLN